MPLAFNIQPFSDVLDMHGDTDSSSTFSLSGYVSISLTSPSPLFVRRKTAAHILLQSLTITFEGQSETLTPGTGYACIRLCSIMRELLSGDPLDLSNEDRENSNQPCQWNVIFDLPIPGWLPTTSVYGDASLPTTGTSYSLYATATFVEINHDRSPLSFVNICGPVRSRTRTVDAPKHPIILRRFVEPQLGSSSKFEMFAYIVDASRAPEISSPSRKTIPSNVLEKIQVVATIPSAMALNEAFIPFVLRVRAKDLDRSERTRVRITGFSIDVEQVEVYRNNSSRHINQYPIPLQNHQPPRAPLRNPHPIHTLYDTGFLGTFKSSVKRSFSILAPTESGRYVISGDGRVFAQGNSPFPEDSWYILETKIPIFVEPYVRDWAGGRKRRITEKSPLFCVEHHMHVVIHCEYDLADSSETTLENLHFSLPMSQVDVPELTVTSGNASENRYEDVWKNIPFTQPLPAYSQLFHTNGERKLDCSIPLPLYEPPPASGLGSERAP